MVGKRREYKVESGKGEERADRTDLWRNNTSRKLCRIMDTT